MQPTLTIKFQDEEDRSQFIKFMGKAKASPGTPAPLYCGLVSSALKRAHIVEATLARPANYFPTPEEAIREVCEGAGQTLAQKCNDIKAALTADEVRRFSVSGAAPYRLAKLLLVSCQDEITRQYSAEAFTKELRALKRIRAHRYV